MASLLNQRDPLDLDMPFAGADPPIRLPSPVPQTCDPTTVGSHSDVAGVAEDLVRQPAQPVAPEVDNHPVTLRDMRDMLTHTMREFQQVVQTTMNQQIETHVRNLLPSIPMPPAFPPSAHPMAQDRSLLLPVTSSSICAADSRPRCAEGDVIPANRVVGQDFPVAAANIGADLQR